MISAADLAAMTAQLTASMPDTVLIQRKTLTSDSAGGQTAVWSTVATVAGRVSPSQFPPWEKLFADRVGSHSNWTVTVPAGTDVRTEDRLLAGTRTLEVIEVRAPRSWEMARVVFAAEIQ
jgi:head-tail adaptor